MTAAGLGSWLDGVVTKISGESPPLPFDAVATVGGVGFTTIAGLGGCCWIGTVVLAAISFDIDTPFAEAASYSNSHCDTLKQPSVAAQCPEANPFGQGLDSKHLDSTLEKFSPQK
jgi:hypothetical protein